MAERLPSGVIAAIPTPVSRSGKPDIERQCRHGAWALKNGCDGLNLLGTTGEANSLSVTARTSIMDQVAMHIDAGRMLVGTGTCDMETTLRLTRHAHRLGYAGALVLPPFYYKNIADAGIEAWFDELVNETANAPIPIFLYNFPQLTGLTFSETLVRNLVRSHPGRIVGLKDSSGDAAYARQIAEIDGFAVYPGSEALYVEADEGTFAGCISATANITAPAIRRSMDAPNDEERRKNVVALREAIAEYPLIPAVKALVAKQQGDAEFARVLPPHRKLDEASLRKLLQMVGRLSALAGQSPEVRA